MTGWTPNHLIDQDWQAPLRPNRGGYTITMREAHGARECLEMLSAMPASPSASLHIGWGSFRNLDIVAARRSGAALLLDINVHQFRVWRAVLPALQLARAPRRFVETVVPMLPRRPSLRQFSDDTREWLLTETRREGSWLQATRPERYAHIRKLAIEGMIAVGCLDMRGGVSGDGRFTRFTAKLDLARQAGFEPDTLYVSNVPWMLAQPNGFFGEDHSQFLPEGVAGGAITQVRANLAEIAPYFRNIICAIHDAPHSRPDDLHWETRLLAPGEFIADAFWRAQPLQPGTAPR